MLFLRLFLFCVLLIFKIVDVFFDLKLWDWLIYLLKLVSVMCEIVNFVFVFVIKIYFFVDEIRFYMNV